MIIVMIFSDYDDIIAPLDKLIKSFITLSSGVQLCYISYQEACDNNEVLYFYSFIVKAVKSNIKI